jgi:hypothetical protein
LLASSDPKLFLQALRRPSSKRIPRTFCVCSSLRSGKRFSYVHLSDCAHKDQRIHELVGVRCGDEQNRAFLRDSPCGAGVDFAEEEVDDDGEYPEEEVVDDIIVCLLAFVGHGGRNWALASVQCWC